MKAHDTPLNQLNYWVARALNKQIQFSPVNLRPGIEGLGNIRVCDEQCFGGFFKFDPAYNPKDFSVLVRELRISTYAPGHPQGSPVLWTASVPGSIEDALLVSGSVFYGVGKSPELAGCRAIIMAAFHDDLPAE